MGMERDLAYTALREHDPSLKGQSLDYVSDRVTEFLGDWERAGKPQMYTYSSAWVAERRAPAAEAREVGEGEQAQGYGVLSANGRAEQMVYLPAEPELDGWVRDTREHEPDERAVMDWEEHNAEVDSQELPDMEYGG